MPAARSSHEFDERTEKVADEPDARHRGTECHADRDSDSKAANDAEQACIERLRQITTGNLDCHLTTAVVT